MDWGKLIDAIKLSPKYLLPISLSTGCILFLKDPIIEKFGLLTIRDQFKPWLGVIFILSTSLLGSHLLFHLYKIFEKWISNSVKYSRMKKTLRELTPEEKGILRGFLHNDTQTQRLNMADGVVKGLEAKLIIYRSTNYGDFVHSWPYNIQPWAWKYLKTHPEILSTTKTDSPI